MTRDEIQSVALRDVQVADGFFSRYADLVREEVIPYQWEALNDRIPGAEKSGCLRNFRIAAGREAGEFTGMVFQDSDIGKWLEAVAYSLTTHPDAALERTADEVIELLEAAQREDGTWTPTSSSRTPRTAGSACATAMSSTAPATCSRARWPTGRRRARTAS